MKPSLQSLAERLHGLPGLLIADVGIAHGGAIVPVAEELLDFPQIFSHLVKQNCGRTVAQPMRGDLPHPERSASGPQPQVESPVRERCPRIPGGASPSRSERSPSESLPEGPASSFSTTTEGFYTVGAPWQSPLLLCAKGLEATAGAFGVAGVLCARMSSGRTRSADQPPSITASRMFPCPSRKPRRAVMLPSPPCESLCIADSSGGETSINGGYIIGDTWPSKVKESSLNEASDSPHPLHPKRAFSILLERT